MTRTRQRSGPGAWTRLRLLTATLATLAIGACGGGNGDGNGGGGGNRATVTLTANPTTITLGQSSSLTWSSNPGTSCTASGAWSGAKSNSGTESVTPSATGTATYTITCSGGTYTQSATASATVTVNAATAFSKTVLVADTAGVGAESTDANLVNPWGVAFGPTTPAWVANNHSGTSTVYDGNGKPQPLATPIVAHLPQPSAGVDFDPTGMVFNGTADFVVTSGAKSGPARFIFVGEGGAIAGWSPTVDLSNAVVGYADAGGANYKAVTLASNGNANFLYAADFGNNKVDVFDKDFAKQPAANFPFTDSALPAGYAPFGIQALPTGTAGAMQIFVAYAKQNGGDEQPGAGLGLVDVYDANGVFVKHLVAEGGKLNAPWGMALAPDDAGTLKNALWVGNFGDGKINAYDPASGAYVGTVADSAGNAFSVPGLWGIAFGNDHANQPHNTLFYAAGTNDEVNGEFGRIDVGNTPPVLNAPPVVTMTAPAAGNVSGTVAVTATATAQVNIAKVEFFAGATSLGTVTTSPYTVQWDTTQTADGAVALTAKATDVDGNVGTSAAVNVTVANNVQPAATFTQIQAQVFTPICTACHIGAGAPEGLHLDAANSYNQLVGVASQEKPALMRVKPGDSANSYLIQKLEGSPGIVGSRMPANGPPFLDQATIDMIKSWIDAGAPNN